jgi:group I intron endonuclease
MHIYVIEQISTKRKYIGQTTRHNAESRWYEHKHSLSTGTHWNRFLLRAWKKYGNSDFKFYILHTCVSTDELNSLEEKYISEYRTMIPRYGFNLRTGGRTNTFSEATKKRLSSAAKKQWKLQDRKIIGQKISVATKAAMKNLSDEKKAKMASSMKNEKVKQKLSNSIREKWKNDPEFRAKCSNRSSHKTEEFRRKQSETMKQYYASRKLIVVEQK